MLSGRCGPGGGAASSSSCFLRGHSFSLSAKASTTECSLMTRPRSAGSHVLFRPGLRGSGSFRIDPLPDEWYALRDPPELPPESVAPKLVFVDQPDRGTSSLRNCPV